MKVYCYGNLIFEGTEEETDEFKAGLIRKFIQVNDILPDVYFIRPRDTFEDYFHNLQILSPPIYSLLCEWKAFFGESFIEFQFHEPTLAGIFAKVYRDAEKKKVKFYSLGYLFLILAHNLKTEVFEMER